MGSYAKLAIKKMQTPVRVPYKLPRPEGVVVRATVYDKLDWYMYSMVAQCARTNMTAICEKPRCWTHTYKTVTTCTKS